MQSDWLNDLKKKNPISELVVGSGERNKNNFEFANTMGMNPL